MGNQICCQQTVQQQHKNQLAFAHTGQNFSHQNIPNHFDKHQQPQSKHQHHSHHQEIHKHPLSPQIIKVVEQHQPFQQQFCQQEDIKINKYGNDVYQGPVDIINRPCKLGKMYKQNGAYFVGYFVSGKAEGPCFYIMNNGSYYKGSMKDNKADCQNGVFQSTNFSYVGGFKDNLFHGKGTEKSPTNHYSFEGIYQMGKKKNGIMKWWANHFQYVYEGSFDSNQKYTGKGKLVDPQGRYEGQFLNGQKHGFGIYYYKNQLRYQGNYAHNKKQGQGKLFNNDNTIAYKGLFKNGMPHGKGMATSKNGNQFQTEWIDGIDSRLL